MSKSGIVIAPHVDDEAIGCWELFVRHLIQKVFYVGPVNARRKIEAETFCYEMGVTPVFSPPVGDPELGVTYYYPDPIFETHPLHRSWGAIGEALLREGGVDVVFYSVNMQAPYIHEVEFPEKKRRVLTSCYSSQKSLWEADSKYFLFEGRCKWLI